MEERYYSYNGKLFKESDLRAKYGDQFDSKIKEHGFSLAYQYDGKVFLEKDLRSKYGDQFDAKIKEHGISLFGQDSQSAGASKQPSEAALVKKLVEDAQKRSHPPYKQKDRVSPPFGEGSAGASEQPSELSDQSLGVEPIVSDSPSQGTKSPLQAQMEREEGQAKTAELREEAEKNLDIDALWRRTVDDYGHDDDLFARADAAKADGKNVVFKADDGKPIALSNEELSRLTQNKVNELHGAGAISSADVSKLPDDELKHVLYHMSTSFINYDDAKEYFEANGWDEDTSWMRTFFNNARKAAGSGMASSLDFMGRTAQDLFSSHMPIEDAVRNNISGAASGRYTAKMYQEKMDEILEGIKGRVEESDDNTEKANWAYVQRLASMSYDDATFEGGKHSEGTTTTFSDDYQKWSSRLKTDPKLVDDFVASKMASGIGSLAYIMSAGSVTGGVGASLAGGTMMGGMQREEAIEAGDMDNRLAGYLGFGIGVAEGLAGMGVLKRMGGAIMKGPKAPGNAFSRAFRSSIQEGSTETMQAWATNLTARELYDETRAIFTEEAWEEGLIGAILGGGMQGSSELANVIISKFEGSGDPLLEKSADKLRKASGLKEEGKRGAEGKDLDLGDGPTLPDGGVDIYEESDQSRQTPEDATPQQPDAPREQQETTDQEGEGVEAESETVEQAGQQETPTTEGDRATTEQSQGVAPKEGDTVTKSFESGAELNFVYKNGKWQDARGAEYTVPGASDIAQEEWVAQNGRGKPEAEPEKPTQKGKEEASEEEVNKVADATGTKPKNIRDLYNINRDMFGQNRVKSLASAIVMDRVVSVMAKRAGVSKSEMYGKIEFRKGEKAPIGALKQESPIFKSTAKEGLGNIQQKAATPEQWVKMITDKGGRGTSQELDWIGLSDFLNDYVKENGVKSVPRDVVEQYINDNQIEIVEVSKGKRVIPFKISEYEWGLQDEDGNRVLPTTSFGTKELAEEKIKSQRLGSDYGTKYSEYTLDGGENYREVLLTLPEKPVENTKEYAKKELEKLGYKVDGTKVTGKDGLRYFGKGAGGFEYNQEIKSPDGDVIGKVGNEKVANLISKLSQGQFEGQLNQSKSTYKSSHWDETNILAHLRINERTLSNGERVMFIEEVQSDWAQEGKKKGFGSKQREAQEEWNRLKAEADKLRAEGKAVPKEMLDRAKELTEIKNKPDPSVPQMPYKKTDQWVGMAMRRAMQMAAQEGFDRVSWVTGEQSADRYNLSKQVDQISYLKREDDGTYEVTASKNDEIIFNKPDIQENELEGIIGKELAVKVINGESTSEGTRGRKNIEGADLKVGGEGMKAFYNSILPKVAKKEAQRFDKKANVEVVELEITKGGLKISDKVYEAYDRQGRLVKRGTNESYIKKIAEQNNGTYKLVDRTETSKQLSIPITPKMRMNLNSAVPLFQGEQGAMLAQDGNYIIYALTDPNVSTPLHELAHVYEHYLTDAERKAIMKFAGTKEWNIETSEKFARGFEKYLADGIAPTVGLQKIFDKFKQWMLDIYNGIIGSDIDIKLNDQMRDIYDKMLGQEPISENIGQSADNVQDSDTFTDREQEEGGDMDPPEDLPPPPEDTDAEPISISKKGSKVSLRINDKNKAHKVVEYDPVNRQEVADAAQEIYDGLDNKDDAIKIAKDLIAKEGTSENALPLSTHLAGLRIAELQAIAVDEKTTKTQKDEINKKLDKAIDFFSIRKTKIGQELSQLAKLYEDHPHMKLAIEIREAIKSKQGILDERPDGSNKGPTYRDIAKSVADELGVENSADIVEAVKDVVDRLKAAEKKVGIKVDSAKKAKQARKKATDDLRAAIRKSLGKANMGLPITDFPDIMTALARVIKAYIKEGVAMAQAKAALRKEFEGTDISTESIDAHVQEMYEADSVRSAQSQMQGELGGSIQSIVEDYYAGLLPDFNSLVERFIDEFGFTKETAKQAAKQLEEKIAAKVDEVLAKKLAPVDKLEPDEKRDLRDRQKMTSKLIKLISMGALKSEHLSAFEDKFGFAHINPREIEVLNTLVDNIAKIRSDPGGAKNNREQVERMQKEFNSRIARIKKKNVAFYMQFLVGGVYTSVLSGLVTQFNANFGALTQLISYNTAFTGSSLLSGEVSLKQVAKGMKAANNARGAAWSRFMVGLKTGISVSNSPEVFYGAVTTERNAWHNKFHMKSMKQAKRELMQGKSPDAILKIAFAYSYMVNALTAADAALVTMNAAYLSELMGGEKEGGHLEPKDFADQAAKDYTATVNRERALFIAQFGDPKNFPEGSKERKNLESDWNDRLRKLGLKGQKGDPSKPSKDFLKRRSMELWENSRSEAINEATQTTKEWMMLGQPDGIFGWMYDTWVKKGLAIHDDTPPLLAVGKAFMAANLMFPRLIASAFNLVITGTPVVGAFYSTTGMTKDRETGEWKWKNKIKDNPQKALSRLAMNTATTMTMLAFFMDTFDWDDEGNLILDPDRSFDWTLNGGGKRDRSITQRKTVAFSFRKEGEEPVWRQPVWAPFMAPMVAILGRMQDQVQGKVNPSGSPGRKFSNQSMTGKAVDAVSTGLAASLAEGSFNSIGRAVKKAMYKEDPFALLLADATTSLTKSVKPLLYRDIRDVYQEFANNHLLESSKYHEKQYPSWERESFASYVLQSAAINNFLVEDFLLDEDRTIFGEKVPKRSSVSEYLLGVHESDSRLSDVMQTYGPWLTLPNVRIKFNEDLSTGMYAASEAGDGSGMIGEKFYIKNGYAEVLKELERDYLEPAFKAAFDRAHLANKDTFISLIDQADANIAEIQKKLDSMVIDGEMTEEQRAVVEEMKEAQSFKGRLMRETQIIYNNTRVEAIQTGVPAFLEKYKDHPAIGYRKDDRRPYYPTR